MSIALSHPMIKVYSEPRLGRIRGALMQWRERLRENAQLARYTERELRDIGLSDVDRLQLLGKPFWRA